MTQTKPIITVDGLTKAYAGTPVVDGISFTVKTGEIFGLLGPNGAGKTTTLEMLEALRSIDAGQATIDGIDVAKQPKQIKQIIGIQLQSTTFYDKLTLREQLRMFASLYGQRVDADALLEKVQLSAKAGSYVEQLSGGQKQRFAIAATLVNQPKVLFLDEPTVALDPQIRRHIWDLVREIARGGVTVLLTTHYIEEAEALCDRVSIINKGVLVDVQTPRTFCENLGAYAVEWDEEGSRSYRFFHTREEARAHARMLEEQMQRVLLRPTNLEDVFIELTGRKEGL